MMPSDLPLWMEFFEDLQHVRGRSLNTVMAYRRDLDLYKIYRQKSTSVLGFYEFMGKQGLSVRSQARVISSIRTYLRFCESRGFPAAELRELRPPRVKTQLPKALSFADFQRLYQACEHPDVARTLRNRITLMLLFGVGCRVSELIALDLHDWNETDRWIRVLGKGQKERLVPLTTELAGLLKKYIIEARPLLIHGSEPTVLVNDRGHRPSRVDIWRWLAAWSKQAGFEEPLGPHRFRHGCATALLEGGADLRSIQMLLGHSSIQTTQVYTSVTTQNLIDTLDEHHPLSKL